MSSKCTKIVDGWGFAQIPLGNYSAPQTLAGFKGAYFQKPLLLSGKERKRREEREKEGSGGDAPGARNPRAATAFLCAGLNPTW